MRSLIDIQKKLLPDLLKVMQKRYQILQYLKYMQPIGRRALSISLGLTERTLRGEVSFLKDQGLISVAAGGMTITASGEEVLDELEETMREVAGIGALESRIKELLGLAEVTVVPGNSDEAPWVQQEMGRAAVGRMKKRLKADDIVAVTGGTTMAAVADMMTPETIAGDVLFVPARGGLGEDVKNQANSICAQMAEKSEGHYRLLHVPERVSDEAYRSMIAEPSIKDVLDLIKSANMVVHGIGDAMMMAKRRKEPADTLQKLQDSRAVGEAFGYYFDRSGRIVHKVRTIGMQLDDLGKVDNVIAVAGGTSKAGAIAAFIKQGQNSSLVTDEGAAKALLRELSL
ncbi:sugar-binding transcriptional regulator [Bacillus marinisedimentorum]|uniref:sugar-binding transcriptional regulator n=1 Tax=Bacillus marinisedimentorum TaxID=1821260 RepID=UPI0007DF4A94|nr:sugar-binding transcriptional regulator [Bacillus marinisedimentorum]